jgi:abortive infection bacteriophage resistance protein
MNSSAHPKIWKSYEDQLNVLISRGLLIEDKDKALEYLERIGYYRLSGYWYPFREQTGPCMRLTDDFKKPKKPKVELLRYDRFLPDSSFQNAVDLYVFDKKLRLIALDALERIEIALRVDVSHTLGKEDRFAYLRPDLFHRSFSSDLNNEGLTNHHRWLGKHAGLITRSKEDFISHNRARYGLPIPIWVSCEVWDFGTMSTLFAGMREGDQDAISKKYGISNGRVFRHYGASATRFR